MSQDDELEMACEYSKYLAENEDDDDRALYALWVTLADEKARREAAKRGAKKERPPSLPLPPSPSLFLRHSRRRAWAGTLRKTVTAQTISSSSSASVLYCTHVMCGGVHYGGRPTAHSMVARRRPAGSGAVCMVRLVGLRSFVFVR